MKKKRTRRKKSQGKSNKSLVGRENMGETVNREKGRHNKDRDEGKTNKDMVETVKMEKEQNQKDKKR